jgi:hypothetical protein
MQAVGNVCQGTQSSTQSSPRKFWNQGHLNKQAKVICCMLVKRVVSKQGTCTNTGNHIMQNLAAECTISTQGRPYLQLSNELWMQA